MSLSKAKINKMVANGLKVAGDLTFNGKLSRTENGHLDNEGNYINGSEKYFDCKILECGISDVKDNSTITRPTDKIVRVFNLTVEVLNTDILSYNGSDYMIVLPSDESVGVGILWKLIIRKK
ncbi:MAG: hypothetical protein RSD40_03250 [Bacilli bacterium]